MNKLFKRVTQIVIYWVIQILVLGIIFGIIPAISCGLLYKILGI